MLTAVPKGWCSPSYRVLENNAPLAIVHLSSYREAGDLEIQGANYRVYREGLFSGAFLLEEHGSVLARAEKPSALLRRFEVEHNGKNYLLEAESIMTRTFVLSEAGIQIGSIYAQHSLTRRSVVDLPEGIPLPVRLFMFWLVMILWKRASDASAAS
jgi:hypothetical protein